MKDKTQKLSLTLLWGGKDFRKFTRDAGLVDEDTLDRAITKIRAHCAKHVNLSMAVLQLYPSRVHFFNEGKFSFDPTPVHRINLKLTHYCGSISSTAV